MNKKKWKWRRVTEVHVSGFHDFPDGRREVYDHDESYQTRFAEEPKGKDRESTLKTYHLDCLDRNGCRVVRNFVLKKVYIERIGE